MPARHRISPVSAITVAILSIAASAGFSAAGTLGDGDDDVAALQRRCGTPTEQHTTENDTPRPPTPTRILAYGHICFEFIPSDKTRPGDPPPYAWNLVGIADATTTGTLDPNEVTFELPCWTGHGAAPEPGSLKRVEASPFFTSADAKAADAAAHHSAEKPSSRTSATKKPPKAAEPHH